MFHILLIVHGVLGLAGFQPLPVSNSSFEEESLSWEVGGGLQAENACIVTPGATADTSRGKCLALGLGHHVQTVDPVVDSLAVGSSVDVNLSLRASKEDALLAVELVGDDGAVLAEHVLDPTRAWSRYRAILATNDNATGPCRVRLSRTGGRGRILIDNIAMEHVGPVEDDFVSLFDGKSLDGWIGDTEGYEVFDEAIRCKPEQGGDLRSVDEYEDFVLRFEFKLSPGGNNGIAVRAPVKGNAAYEGMEIQVLDSMSPGYATLKPWQYHGSAYGIAAAERGWLLPPGSWNREEIRLEGSHLKVTLNGHVILDVDVQAAIQAGAPSGNAHAGASRTSGHIGFCGHGSDVSFRDIRIQTLGSAKPTSPTE
ncbi:MAG: DUF1080 domain-containing protein [Phycisphaerales bacterium]|nr:DUF1080 domain-containing protein [Phycisphaerales bacterium]